MIYRKGSTQINQKRNLLMTWDDLGNRAEKHQCHERRKAK